MPGWPSVGRTDDQRLAEALRRAESRAVDGLYDSYADRLNDYASSLLDDPDAAAGAVHDAFVTAHGRAGALREPTRLRAWLYALTRYQCTARQGRTPPHGTALDGLTGDEDDPELAAIVRESLGELGQKEREVLFLAVRHGLSTSEVGAVTGLTSRQTATKLARATDHLENAAAAVVLARTGRAHCPDLSALLDSIDGPLPQPLRRRLVRHIVGCKECTEGRHRRVSAERLLDTVPVAFPPLSLRRRVAETCARPERDAVRAAIMPAVGVLDKNGFPPVGSDRRAKAPRAHRTADPADQADTAARGFTAHDETPRHGTRTLRAVPPMPSPAGHSDTPRRGMRAGEPPRHGDTTRYASAGAYEQTAHRETAYERMGGRGNGRTRRRGGGAPRRASRRTPVFATIACALLATGAMVVVTGQDASHRKEVPQTLRFPSRSPQELQISYAPEPTDAAPASEPSRTAPPRPAATRSPSSAAQAPAASSTMPRTPASRTPTRRPPASPAKLVVSCPKGLGDGGAGVILVSARGGTVSWRASAGGGLAVTPANGVLASGVKARLSVSPTDPAQAGKGTVTLSSAAGGASCTVSWDGQDMPPASEPPPDQPPTSEPTPTGTPSEESSGGVD
ncbi:sigma-70 family RNA polymerase sigma factor [Sphaerisporangium album]|uniref:sigma-70 family RNA polymerase sigma factor n=1 Tax=Sphaerisporangium album TaxID=509200 RepID=UPI0015F03209|nr:sigma-70 family RNA polymerase sigma factor [Sphaerisporangium album]